MKLFDEGGNFVGDFIEASGNVIEHAKETVCSWADISIVLGIIGFILAPGVTLAIIGVILVFQLFISLIKLIINIVWWIIRLPFTLIFLQRFPEF